MVRAVITGFAVFCGLFAIALGIADIRVGCFVFIILAAMAAGAREVA